MSEAANLGTLLPDKRDTRGSQWLQPQHPTSAVVTLEDLPRDLGSKQTSNGRLQPPVEIADSHPDVKRGTNAVVYGQADQHPRPYIRLDLLRRDHGVNSWVIAPNYRAS